MCASSAWMPSTMCSVNEAEASPSRRTDWSSPAIIMGLKVFSSKCPMLPPTVIPTWLPMTCRVSSAQPAQQSLNLCGPSYPLRRSLPRPAISCAVPALPVSLKAHNAAYAAVPILSAPDRVSAGLWPHSVCQHMGDASWWCLVMAAGS